jgi:hypothetical protein
MFKLSKRLNSPAGREFLKAAGSMILTWAVIGAGAAVVMMLGARPAWPRGVRAVEPPPEQYAAGPTLSGKTYQLDLPDPAQVNYLCTLVLGPAWPPGGYWMGCYNGKMDAVIVPSKGAWPSEVERQALIRHEWAHARGWAHQTDGRYGRRRDTVLIADAEPVRSAIIPIAPEAASR